jgi:hypothetical protein
MQYYNVITMTFHHLLGSDVPFDRLTHGKSVHKYTDLTPARLFRVSKASLQALLHMFYQRHGFEDPHIFLLQVLVQLGFDALEHLRTPEAHQQPLVAAIKATRATLILCAKGLRDQGRNFFLSELVFRVLREKMNPIDAELLEDWAQIKGEARRDSVTLEHVDSEYPVNVKSITSDPTEWRLRRLLTSAGDLKLPKNTGEQNKGGRVSRTWRSVVLET